MISTHHSISQALSALEPALVQFKHVQQTSSPLLQHIQQTVRDVIDLLEKNGSELSPELATQLVQLAHTLDAHHVEIKPIAVGSLENHILFVLREKVSEQVLVSQSSTISHTSVAARMPGPQLSQKKSESVSLLDVAIASEVQMSASHPRTVQRQRELERILSAYGKDTVSKRGIFQTLSDFFARIFGSVQTRTYHGQFSQEDIHFIELQTSEMLHNEPDFAWCLTTLPQAECISAISLILSRVRPDLSYYETQSIAQHMHAYAMSHLPTRVNDTLTELWHNGVRYERPADSQPLGAGGMGKVYLFHATKPNIPPVIVKVFQNAMEPEVLLQELNAHRHASATTPEQEAYSKHVIGLLGIAPYQNSLISVQEFADAGDMENALNQLNQSELSIQDKLDIKRLIFQQFLAGMHHIAYNRGMLHLDIKPQNIFLTKDGVAKLGDFGVSRVAYEGEREKAQTGDGTSYFMAPEMLNKKKMTQDKCDIWSMGVMLYEAFAQESLFKSERLFDVYKEIDALAVSPEVKAQKREILAQQVGHEAAALIMQMFEENPDNRPSIDQIRSHPFFAHVDIAKAQPQLQALLVRS